MFRLSAGPQGARAGFPCTILHIVCCTKVHHWESGALLVHLGPLMAEDFFFFFAQWAISLSSHVHRIMPAFF